MDFNAVDAENSLVIPASRRQARFIREQYATQQLSQGHDVWPSLKVMPWSAFLNYCWELAQEENIPLPVRLSSNQSQYLWKQMVSSSDVVKPLLNSKQTEQLSFDAWRLCQQWQIESLEVMPGDQDQEAFRDWFSVFQKQLSANGWIDMQQQGNYLATLAPLIQQQLPATIITYGFQQPTPQQTALLNLLDKNKQVINWSFSSGAAQNDVKLFSASTPSHELLAAVRWASDTLLEQPNKKIAIVVPDLEQKRTYIERLIYREFYANNLVSGKEITQPLHDFSIDEPLLQQPLVAVVMDWVALTHKSLTKTQLQHILLSPYLYQEQELHWQSTQFELLIRKSTKAYYSFDDIVKLSRYHKVELPWLDVLEDYQKELQANTDYKSQIKSFIALLSELHWTGYHSLNSREYQVQQTFIEAVKTSQSIQKVASEALTFARAMSLLKEQLEQQSFHQKQPKAPLQIMGMLEAIGVTFEAVWLVGATDQVLPQKATPNPFLSKALQRKYDLPGSSHNREVEYAQSLIYSLLENKELNISYAEYEGEQEQMVSPLLALMLPDTHAIKLSLDTELPAMLESWPQKECLEYYDDHYGEALEEHFAVKGGTGLLRMQAASPFDAYLRYRLELQAFEEDELGVSFMDRGNLFHKAMQLIWSRLETQSALLELSDEALMDLVNKTIEFVLSEASRHIYLLQNSAFFAIEVQRLEALILESLELDKNREPFKVIGTEVPREIELSGLKFSIVIDRIDQLNDGSLIIIDYKTGQPVLSSLFRDPIAEPQLLLYAISESSHQQNVAGIVFMQAHLKACKYIGVTEEPDMLKGVTALRDYKNNPYPDDFSEAIQTWKQILEQIAEDFKHGNAQLTDYSGNFTDHHSVSRWAQRDVDLESAVHRGGEHD